MFSDRKVERVHTGILIQDVPPVVGRAVILVAEIVNAVGLRTV